jgi:hypothetical protein
VRQWRQDALVLLRLPAYGGALRALCDRHTRASHQRGQALSRAWLGRGQRARQRARARRTSGGGA